MTVDEAYWRRYYRVHNEARFTELVDTFYDPEAIFSNPRNEFRGRQALIDYFETAGAYVKLTLEPVEIWIKPETSATELLFTAEAKQDVPGFVTGPLKAGETARINMAATYRMKGDRILHASVYWGHASV
ncbi:MAG: nuclear transport factor 2 family protein [Pseudomonadota bacterium]